MQVTQNETKNSKLNFRSNRRLKINSQKVRLLLFCATVQIAFSWDFAVPVEICTLYSGSNSKRELIIFTAEERNRSLRERLELQEKRWTSHVNEQKQSDFSITANEKNVREMADRIHALQMDMAEKNEEINSLRSREKSTEEYSARLARKLDRLMVENHQRTQKELRK